jgi:hypothetical protein
VKIEDSPKVLTRDQMIDLLMAGSDPKTVTYTKWEGICSLIRDHLKDTSHEWVYSFAYGSQNCALCELNRGTYGIKYCHRCPIKCQEAWVIFDFCVSRYIDGTDKYPDRMLAAATEMLKLIRAVIPEREEDLLDG